MRPAFYALRPGGWRDYVTLLHPPYTAWHLSYVVVGGCLAPSVPWGRLGLTVAAFALAMGVGAHALDELNGRPLATAIPARALVAIAVVSVAAACVIGIAVSSRTTAVAAGVRRGRRFSRPGLQPRALRRTVPFRPLVRARVGRVSRAHRLRRLRRARPLRGGACGGWAASLSFAQRRLSTSVRRLRRDVVDVGGEIQLADGAREPIARETLTAAPEAALRLLTLSTTLAAAALVVVRL